MRWMKLSKSAILPTRGTENSAGYDIYANEMIRILPGETKVVKTGITFEDLPENQYIQLSLRSSISIHRPFIQPNGVGVIDSDYAGREIGLILWNRGDIPAVVDQGEKMAQAIILQYYTTENEIKPTTKRSGGYGSTDKK